MFWNKFPYTNFHELNLDWIIEKIKNLEIGALRPATRTTLGAVKVGDGIDLAGDGTISVENSGGGGGSYELPVATSETLGGVKVGNGLSITPDGTLNNGLISTGTYVYVSDNGNDLNDGSAGMPFKTITHALAMTNGYNPTTIEIQDSLTEVIVDSSNFMGRTINITAAQLVTPTTINLDFTLDSLSNCKLNLDQLAARCPDTTLALNIHALYYSSKVCIDDGPNSVGNTGGTSLTIADMDIDESSELYIRTEGRYTNDTNSLTNIRNRGTIYIHDLDYSQGTDVDGINMFPGSKLYMSNCSVKATNVTSNAVCTSTTESYIGNRLLPFPYVEATGILNGGNMGKLTSGDVMCFYDTSTCYVYPDAASSTVKTNIIN